MSRDWRLSLDDVRTSAERVQRYIQGLNVEQFVQDEKTFDAVIRNLEIIGEAIKNIPQAKREHCPDVDWRGLMGLRDIISHKYFGLDEGILWDVARNEVPLLLQCVADLMAGADNDGPKSD
jgi:uncharacterized protein with HEPN domain